MGLLKGPGKLTWRLAVVNCAVAVAVFVVLAVSPAPVTFPSSHWEALMLLAGAVVLVVTNGAVAGAAAAAALRRTSEPAYESPDLQRLQEYEHFHVTSAVGVIGVVDEVLGDLRGEPAALVVQDGWFAARRFVVPLDEVSGVDMDMREITVGGRSGGA